MGAESAPASSAAAPERGTRVGLVELAWASAGAVTMLAYRGLIGRYYGSFIPQGTGMERMVPEELAQLSLFMAFGLVAAVALTMALRGTEAVSRVVALAQATAGRPRTVVALLSLIALAGSLVVGRVVLRGAAVTDDEHVYQFVARTLETGALVAPSPATDLEFYREQFVVLTPEVRYGKYPIGHPLVLALGDRTGAAPLVLPFLTAGTVALSFVAGRRALGLPSALLGTLLLATSPQFVMTGGTWLSQVTSAWCTAGALAALLAADGERRRAWLAAAGAALAYGVLVRPMPHVLLAAGAAAWVLSHPAAPPWRRRIVDVLALGLPVVAGVAAVLVVNRLQSGASVTSGYQAFHGTGGGFRGLAAETLGADLPSVAASVFAGLFRENVWLLGWPLSLLPCLFARRTRAAGPLWGLVGVALLYRVLLPKAGVAPTGPVYFAEVVPALCLLAGDGLWRLGSGQTWVGPLLCRGAAPPRATVTAGFLAAALINLALFTPARLEDLGRMGAAQDAVWALLRARGTGRAVVFHRGVVPYWTRLSWAYYPRCNSPTLDDDVLFLLRRGEDEAAGAEVALWRRRYPDRAAFLFDWPPEGAPRLVELASTAAPAAP